MWRPNLDYSFRQGCCFARGFSECRRGCAGAQQQHVRHACARYHRQLTRCSTAANTGFTCRNHHREHRRDGWLDGLHGDAS